jgi:vacuolar fusion protein MON1
VRQVRGLILNVFLLKITQPFELYLTLSPMLPKSAVIGAANAVAKWVKKEESKLFLKDAPTF